MWIEKIIDELRLMQQYNHGISKNNQFLGNTPNEPTKYRTKIDEVGGMYHKDIQSEL